MCQAVYPEEGNFASNRLCRLTASVPQVVVLPNEVYLSDDVMKQAQGIQFLICFPDGREKQRLPTLVPQLQHLQVSTPACQPLVVFQESSGSSWSSTL